MEIVQVFIQVISHRYFLKLLVEIRVILGHLLIVNDILGNAVRPTTVHIMHVVLHHVRFEEFGSSTKHLLRVLLDINKLFFVLPHLLDFILLVKLDFVMLVRVMAIQLIV